MILDRLKRWVGKSVGLVSPFWSDWYGGDNESGEAVTHHTAMNLSAWWACCRLRTVTIATLPSGLFEKQANGDRRPRNDHRMYELLHDSPNADQTPVEFWEGRVGPLCINGNSFAEKRMIGDRIVSLEPMPFTDVRPRRDQDNRLVYDFTDRGKQETLPASKVWHLRGFGMDGDMGLSPLAYASRSIGGALAAEKAAARVYGKGMRATGIFTLPTDMDKDQREQFQKNYIDKVSGAKGEGSQLVLPPGFKWQPVSIPSKDAELLLSRNFNVGDVCRWMGVPPILVGHSQEGQTMWGSGVEQIILGWLVLGLRADLKRIESSVNFHLLTRAERAQGLYFEFNFEGLLRADSAARAQLMQSLVSNGLRTRNEMRALDNMPRIGGADTLTVQSAMVNLDQLGSPQQRQDAETVRNALRSWLEVERQAA